MLLTTFLLLGSALADYTLREVGSRNTLDWRMWLEKDGNTVSFWHDIPLYPDASKQNIINMYVEIPRWTDGKIETHRNEPLNPIFHDDKKKLPKFIYSVWPQKSYPFNYGSIPQTWEDSTRPNNLTGYVGDNDPMDIFDISSIEPGYVGEIRTVKILGGLAMIDDDTTDFKVIAVDVRDPLSKVVETVDDLEKYRPGMKKTFYDWFTYYKVVKGDGTNTIIGNKYQDSEFMTHEINLSHDFWLDLMRGKTQVKKINRWQTSNPKWCKTYVPAENTTAAFKLPTESDIKPAAPRPIEYDQWYYLDSNFEVINIPA